ncbi:FBL4 [Symbiodinium sp. CCMP2592]|nr:FBL4 [Symbiodinium sp. CCMP2592]
MGWCREIPAAAWQRLVDGAKWPKLTKVNFEECFGSECKGIEAAAGLLAFLGRCPELKELGLSGCSEIRAAAWQQLEGAKWPKLTKVSFDKCFGSESKGIEAAAGLLAFLGRCPELKELQMRDCSEIPAAAWQQLEGAKWPKLTKVSFAWCFGSESKGIEAAAGLLAFLGRCPELKELDMRYCSEIPAVAWQRLEGAKWPKLTKVSFAGCFGSESKGIEAAAGLLAFLGCCPELKDLSMRACGEIPAAAWQRLVDDAKWPKLAKVNLNECFGSGSKGIEAAAGLLAFLGRCPELEELRMESCDQIPAAAWQQLETATWQKLTRVDFDGCFGEDSKGADGAAGLLTALARCPELKDGYITGL